MNGSSLHVCWHLACCFGTFFRGALALALDYDCTLGYDGKVRESKICALEKVRESGRKLLRVTGRPLEDLLVVFERQDLFEWIVAESGGLLYCPRNREWRLLSEPVTQLLYLTRQSPELRIWERDFGARFARIKTTLRNAP